MKRVDAEKIFALKQELGEFLDDHPELRTMQEKIKQTLDAAGKNPLNRNCLIQQMMLESLEKLRVILNQLRAPNGPDPDQGKQARPRLVLAAPLKPQEDADETES